MGGWFICGAGIAGFVALCWWCVPPAAQRIERDVFSRTIAALKDGSITVPKDGVRISGRDIVLIAPRGQALASEATREMVSTIRGVDSVRTIAQPPDPQNTR